MAGIFLTGGTGYLGGNLARRLGSEGEEVVILARKPEQVPGLPRGPCIRIARGDVTDIASLREGMKGCDRAIHAAAHVRAWDADPGRFEAVNVGGLTNFLQAGREAGIAKMIYTSSFIALGPTDGATADEDWEIPHRRFNNAYERTKAAADSLARREAKEGTPLVILYPGVIYGPGRITAGNLIGRTIQDFLNRRVPGILGNGDRRFCYAYVENVVDGHVAALSRAGPGERYILGGENRTTRELFAELERITGIPAPRRRIPYWAAGLAGRAQRWRARLTGRDPEITDEVVKIYRHEWAYHSGRAEARLGYRITPFGEGLASTVAGLREPPE